MLIKQAGPRKVNYRFLSLHFPLLAIKPANTDMSENSHFGRGALCSRWSIKQWDMRSRTLWVGLEGEKDKHPASAMGVRWLTHCSCVPSLWTANEKQSVGPGFAHSGCPCPSGTEMFVQKCWLIQLEGKNQSIQQGMKASNFILFSLLISKSILAMAWFFSGSNLRMSCILS